MQIALFVVVSLAFVALLTWVALKAADDLVGMRDREWHAFLLSRGIDLE